MSLLSVEVVDDADAHKYVHSLLDFLLYPEKLDAHVRPPPHLFFILSIHLLRDETREW
jgi:hypothetical protein